MTVIITAYIIRHLVFTFTVLKNTKYYGRPRKFSDVTYQPEISVIIPACDEEKVIGRLLKSMCELTYPRSKLQIIVIDDGSIDRTGLIADQYARKHSFIEVLHRDRKSGRKGKPAALNSVLSRARGEITFCLDADYMIETDFFERLVQEFADPKVGAVQARVVVENEPKNVITRLVSLERIGGYRVDQQAREELGLIPQFGGTAGGVRTSLLKSLGGWDENILAEDTDLTFRISLAGSVVRYVGEVESYEEAVKSLRAFSRQRYRWSRGHMQCAFKHFFPVLRSRNLNLKQKTDGLLLLGIYFLPVLALLCWVISIPLFLFFQPSWTYTTWIAVLTSLYSFMGSFAPFFEVGIGAYLDGRSRAQWLTPLLLFTFLFNIPICTKAFVDAVASEIRGKKGSKWHKTEHSGDGNSYITF